MKVYEPLANSVLCCWTSTHTEVLLFKYLSLWYFMQSKKARSEGLSGVVVNELKQLQGSQLELEVDSLKISIERIALHGHLADLVAKTPSSCFCQFNGKNGCSVCSHPRERIQKGEGSICIYPFINQDPACQTHRQTLLHARTAEIIKKSVFRTKHVSPLLHVLKVPSQVLLDYMHPVLPGEFLRRMRILVRM